MTNSARFIDYLRKLLCCTGGIIGLASCSLGGGVKSTSLRVPPQAPVKLWQIEQISSSPHTYRAVSTNGSSPLFFSAVKECGNKKDSLPSAVRQLFVGFQKVRIRRQEDLTLGGLPGLLAVIDAELERTPLSLASYTLKNGTCSYDYVFWSTNSETIPQETTTELTELVEELFKDGVH